MRREIAKREPTTLRCSRLRLSRACGERSADLGATVLFQHNVEAMIWKRHYEVQTNAAKKAYLYRQWRKMRRFEAKTCPQFDCVSPCRAKIAT